MVLELGDTSLVKNSASGITCDVEFKTKGFFSGTYNAISGKIKGKKGEIGDISGKWSDVVELQRGKGAGKEILFDAHAAAVTSKVVQPEEEQEPNESRRLWSHVTDAIKKKDLDAATDAKSAIEDSQRESTRLREEKGQKWSPRFFELRDEEYHPKFQLSAGSKPDQVEAARSFIFSPPPLTEPAPNPAVLAGGTSG